MKALMEMYMIAWGKHTKAKSFEIWDLADFSYILFIENSVYAAVMAGHADAVKSTNCLSRLTFRRTWFFIDL